MVTIALLVAAWLACGAIAYGAALYDFTESYPEGDHRRFALLFGALGAAGLAVVLLCARRRGLRFRPYSLDERRAAFRERYPGLGMR